MKEKENVIRKLFLKELKKYKNLEDIPDLIRVKTLIDFQQLLDSKKIYMLFESDWGMNFYVRCQHGLVNVFVNRTSVDDICIYMNVITENDMDILIGMIISRYKM